MIDAGPRLGGKNMGYKMMTHVLFAHRHLKQLSICCCVVHFQGNFGSNYSIGSAGGLSPHQVMINGWLLGGLELGNAF